MTNHDLKALARATMCDTEMQAVVAAALRLKDVRYMPDYTDKDVELRLPPCWRKNV